MRETRSYGSVRGPGRKARPYSEPRVPNPGNGALPGLKILESRDVPDFLP